MTILIGLAVQAASSTLIINEIMYNEFSRDAAVYTSELPAAVVVNAGTAEPPAVLTDAAEDWVELYNTDNTSKPVDVAEYMLLDDDDTHTYMFPPNTYIPPGGYLVLAKNISKFKTMHPEVSKWAVIGDFDFAFSSKGELVRIFNKEGMLVDYVTYNNKPPWPVQADGTGFSLELVNPNRSRLDPGNWKASKVKGGTPGGENSVYT